MKLLYITNGINGSGGLERVLSVKASVLADQYGYEVSLLVLNDAYVEPFYDFGSQVKFFSIDVKGNPFEYIKSYKKGIQYIVDKLRPDVISVCDDGLKGFLIPHFLKTSAKIIYERHVSKLAETDDNQSLLKRAIINLKWSLMSLLGNKFEKFVLLTEGNRNEWKSLKNLIVIPNPLSFYPEKSSDLEIKRVICVGKITFQKGQDLLLKSWQKVNAKHPEWILEMYGKENREFLDISELPSQNVFWYPPAKDIEQKYLNTSIYVMSSRFEGFGMVLIEAMACGVPCVSFNCNYGPSDIIKDNVDGFIVDKENTDSLAERILELMENESLRKKMGALAKENVKKYDPQIIAGQWDRLFKKL